MSRRLCSIILALCLLLVGCSSTQAPIITVEDEAFSCTPQELIDLINSGASETPDVLTIPDYASSYKTIEIGGTGLTLELTEAKTGALSSIRLYWSSGLGARPENLTSSGFYVGVLLNLFAPSDAEDIVAAIRDAMSLGGDMQRASEGVVFDFRSFGGGGNRLTISPAK